MSLEDRYDDEWFAKARKSVGNWYWLGVPTLFRCPYDEDPVGTIARFGAHSACLAPIPFKVDERRVGDWTPTRAGLVTAASFRT